MSIKVSLVKVSPINVEYDIKGLPYFSYLCVSINTYKILGVEPTGFLHL